MFMQARVDAKEHYSSEAVGEQYLHELLRIVSDREEMERRIAPPPPPPPPPQRQPCEHNQKVVLDGGKERFKMVLTDLLM